MRPPAGLAGRALAAVLLLPSVLHLWGRGGEGLWLVLLAAGLPLALALADRERPERALGLCLACAHVAPIVPTLAGVFGFSLERCAVAGALAGLAWTGWLAPRASGGRALAFARLALVAWGSWNVGGALRATWLALPNGGPLDAQILRAALLDPLGFRPMTEAAFPLQRGWQELELALLAWAALEVALARPLAERLASAFAWAVGLGALCVPLFYWIALGWRGESQLDLWRQGVGRVHVPMPDHNALGSALALALPLLAAGAALRWRARRRRSAALFAALLALATWHLVLTRSKAGLLGAAVGLGVLAVLAAWRAAPRLRPWLGGGAAIGALALALVQVLPDDVLRALERRRYLHDLVRVARFDQVGSYLAENRLAVWERAAAVAAREPLFGAGPARLPTELGALHDPAAAGGFNPLHENAHSQVLQWAAELGLPAASIGVALATLCIFACLRALARGGSLHCAGLAAALCALAANLAVGHSLLVPAVGALAALALGAAAAALGSHPPAALEPAARPRAARWHGAGAAVAALALLPVAWKPRAPLAASELGCFPWEWLSGSEPERMRLLAPRAAWFQAWGQGSRMLLPVKDLRPFELPGAARVRARAGGGAWVELELPRQTQRTEQNPLGILKLDAPAGTQAGELVLIELECDTAFAGSKIYFGDQSIVGCRMLPPLFKEPGAAD